MAIRRFNLTNIVFILFVVGILVFLFKPQHGSNKPVKAPKTSDVAATSNAPDVPTLLAQRYKDIEKSIDISRVKADVETLSSYSSRMVGYPGCDAAADYVENQFKTIGLENVSSESFKVTVPVDEGSRIVVAGQEIPIYALWPNLVRTSHLPPSGMDVHVIDAGSGKLPDFDGKKVKDSAALVDFNSGTEWLNAPRLGARVLLFVEPDATMRGEGEAKFSAIPVSMPRFWISKDNAAKVRALIAQGKADDAKIYCKMPWEKVSSRNIIGAIRGTDPKLRDQWIVLHAYYDGTSVVPALAPGAESTSGISGLLELARLYKDPKFAPKRSVMFIATGAHFQGLAGMREFIENHIDSYRHPGTTDKIHATLNKNWPAAGDKKASPVIPAALVLVVALMITWGIWKQLRGLQRRFAWLVAIPIILAVVSVALCGGTYKSFNKGFDYEIPNPKDFYVWCGLDLSSQTQGVGIFYKGYFYDFREDIQNKFSDLASRTRENSERIAHILDFTEQLPSRFADGVNPISGKNWRNFVPGKFALDSEVVTLAGGKGVSFVSIDDGRQLVDTPFDTVEKMNFDNLRKQLVMISCLTDHWFRDPNGTMEEEIIPAKIVNNKTIAVDDPLQVGFVRGVYTDKFGSGKNYYKASSEKDMPKSLVSGKIALASELPADAKEVYVQYKPLTKLGVNVDDKCQFTRMGLQGGFARLSGNVVQYDPKRSFVPNLRVGDCLAVVRSASKSFMGVRANIIDKTSGRDGIFSIPGVAPLTAYGSGKTTVIGAYKLDQVNGDIVCAPDQGSYGKFYPTEFSITTGYKEMPVIVFDCKATSIYDLVDPQSLKALAALAIYDGDTNGEPRQFGSAVAVPEPQNPHVEDMAVIFTEDTQKSKSLAVGEGATAELRRVRLKMVMSAGPAANRLLLLNSTLGDEVIPAKIVEVAGKKVNQKAMPVGANWQPTMEGVYLPESIDSKQKNYYRLDPGEVDYSFTNGVVDVDESILGKLKNKTTSEVYVKTIRGDKASAALVKVATIDIPWYKSIQGLYLDKDAKGEDYRSEPLNDKIAKTLRSSDVCIKPEMPDVDKIYAKVKDEYTGKISVIEANVQNIVAKAVLTDDNPLEMKVLGIYDNQKCEGTNYYNKATNAMMQAYKADGPLLSTKLPNGKNVWIKTDRGAPVKAKVASFIKVGQPISSFVEGVYSKYSNKTLSGKNYCYFPSGAYNSASLLSGEIQLTAELPENISSVYIKPVPNPEGSGYDVTDGGTLDETSYKVGNDMWKLDEYRLASLAKKGVVNEGLQSLHDEARRYLDLANQAKDSLNYSVFDSYCRAAWGYEARAYPDVTSTSQDVVNGVIFYLFLMLPFAFFCERLFFAFPTIGKQLLAFFIMFLLLFATFYVVHPAFQIVGNSSLVILIAFIMLALSGLVISIITSKFEEQLKQFNKSVSGIHKADIGRMSVAAAAFSLGISNMRRRKARTVLTTITLILLTFTVLSFTSIVSELKFNKVPAKKDSDTHVYDGIMLRTAMWEPLQEIAYRHLKDEFGNEGRKGKVYPVAPRAWFFGTQLGEQSFLTLRNGKNSYDAKAAVGMVPDEAEVMNFNTKNRKAFIAGDWFGYKDGKRVSDRVDPYSIIIPDVIAEKLEITPDQVGKAKIEFAGSKYTVIAIVKNDIFKKVKDLDNEPLTPVDFILMSKQSSSQQGGGGDAGFREYTHHEPSNTFIVPYDTLMGMGGDVRSIAIKFAGVDEVRSQLEGLMPRLGLNLYAGIDGSIYRYSSIAGSSSKGFSNVFIPVLIAALIVLNTMLGSVFERVKEIGIFSSIGIAPNHIAVLFIAESMVYANLGAVAGYVLGQGASRFLMATNLLPGLYLNFSSMSAVTSTLVVVAVVLLSTLYPARKASEVATPSVERSWRVADPVGDDWDIILPFAVTGDQAKGVNGFLCEWFQAYEEYSIGDFVTQDVKSGTEETKNGIAYVISSKAWLAPFDLGVSQIVTLKTVPTSMEDVYEVQLRITRESGDISNWKRVNRRFLNTLRKQFLIWRTMNAQDRDKYLSEDTADDAAAIEGETANI